MRGYIICVTFSVGLSLTLNSIGASADSPCRPIQESQSGIAVLHEPHLESISEQDCGDIAPAELDEEIRRQAMRSWPQKKDVMTQVVDVHRNLARILVPPTKSELGHKMSVQGFGSNAEGLQKSPTAETMIQLWIEPHVVPRLQSPAYSHNHLEYTTSQATAQTLLRSGAKGGYLAMTDWRAKRIPQTLSPKVMTRVIPAKGIRYSRTPLRSHSPMIKNMPIVLRAAPRDNAFQTTSSSARFKMNVLRHQETVIEPQGRLSDTTEKAELQRPLETTPQDSLFQWDLPPVR